MSKIEVFIFHALGLILCPVGWMAGKFKKGEMKKMDKLKPCPFCGGEIEFIPSHVEEQNFVNSASIICRKCRKEYVGATFIVPGEIESEELTNDILINWWNTRPAEDALKAEVERLKAENAELRYIVEQFSKWTAEGGCVKANYPDFPCWWERNRLELELDDYCDDDDEREHKCWVEYYRWKFRQEIKSAKPEKGGDDE